MKHFRILLSVAITLILCFSASAETYKIAKESQQPKDNDEASIPQMYWGLTNC